MSNTRQPFNEQPINRRPGGGNNLPGALSKKMYWKDATMTFAKLIVWLFVEHRAGSDAQAVAGDWAKLGITGNHMLAEVRKLIPSFDEVWAERHPSPNVTDSVKAAQLYNRAYHMYTEVGKDGKRRRMVSKEHPLRSRRLRPHCGTARQIYATGKPVSRARLEHLFRENLNAGN